MEQVIRSLPQAFRIIKEMGLSEEEGLDYRSLARESLKGILEYRMRDRVDCYLEEISWRDEEDRRNGVVHVSVVPEVTAETLLGLTVKKIRRGAIVYTDKFKSCDSPMFCGYRHLKVDHGKVFLGKVHINGLEGYWSWARNGLSSRTASPKNISLST